MRGPVLSRNNVSSDLLSLSQHASFSVSINLRNTPPTRHRMRIFVFFCRKGGQRAKRTYLSVSLKCFFRSAHSIFGPSFGIVVLNNHRCVVRRRNIFTCCRDQCYEGGGGRVTPLFFPFHTNGFPPLARVTLNIYIYRLYLTDNKHSRTKLTYAAMLSCSVARHPTADIYRKKIFK